MTATIWQYQSETQSASILKKAFLDEVCPCCVPPSRLEAADYDAAVDGQRYLTYRVVRVCPECGWWIIGHDTWDASCGTAQGTLRRTLATGAALSVLEPPLTPAQLDILCTEVEQHLKGKGKSDSWKPLEDATAAVLKNFGLKVTPTGRRGDGGTDIVVTAPQIPLGVVQVKHSKNKIGASVMRELVGTATLESGKHALLVASSRFTSGAFGVQKKAKGAGISVELVNGEEVLRALKLTARTSIPRLRDLLGVAPPKIAIIEEEVST